MSRPDLESLKRAPKALLHDHLDGGVRPATVLELAEACGYKGLPTTDVDELAKWLSPVLTVEISCSTSMGSTTPWP
jgi:adenosine deaminase